MRSRISIRGSVRPSVGPSVGPFVRRSVSLSVRPSVRYASAKTAFLGCFWPRWDPTLKQMINQHVLRASSTTQSFHPSVRPSVSPYISRRPGTNHRSKKMLKTPDLGKSLFWCISYQFMAKIKKSAWKYRIQSLKIAKMKHFYTFFISEIRIVASSCLKNIWKVWQ